MHTGVLSVGRRPEGLQKTEGAHPSGWAPSLLFGFVLNLAYEIPDLNRCTASAGTNHGSTAKIASAAGIIIISMAMVVFFMSVLSQRVLVSTVVDAETDTLVPVLQSLYARDLRVSRAWRKKLKKVWCPGSSPAGG
jgi:hypothetical protein